MNDFDKMRDKIGNRFAMILVASERMREIQRERRAQEEFLRSDSVMNPEEYIAQRKRMTIPAKQVFDEIERGEVGIDYIDKVRNRTQKKKSNKLDRF